ncbi:MAG: GHMP kinase [Elusimicrobia bacterium]|nr:GHMP kinase [Elusimicrobiota bacterium]
MIISRTPFRVSFVGGGTDLRAFCSKEPGKVLSTGIDKYVYVAVKRQSAIVDYKYRISWSRIEFKQKIDDIEHPIVREALRLLDIDFPIEISTFADVPANTGLGSSSAFAVGLLHALYALKGKIVTKSLLAAQAAKIEIELLKRPIGAQDHYAAAYGTLSTYTFMPNGEVVAEPVFIDPLVRERLQGKLMLFYTGVTRDAHEVLKGQSDKTAEKFESLRKMKALVDPLRDVMSSGEDDGRIGKILHENWLLKRGLADAITSSAIDRFYDKALAAGAAGGKLLGAGGGGFLLFYVEPERQAAVQQALSDLYRMPFRFDTQGTRITYYDQAIL